MNDHRPPSIAIFLSLLLVCGSGIYALAGQPGATTAVTLVSSALGGNAARTAHAAPVNLSDQIVVNGGGRNLVTVVNRDDNRLRVSGRVQVNAIYGPNAAPVNEAYAYSSCTGCSTFAVALQMNLIPEGTRNVAPENLAVALNYKCTGCYTVARALQYDEMVSDPTNPPARIHQLINAMNETLLRIQNTPGESIADAEAQVDQVIAQFNDLTTSLNDKRTATTDTTSPNAGPPPTASPTTTSGSNG